MSIIFKNYITRFSLLLSRALTLQIKKAINTMMIWPLRTAKHGHREEGLAAARPTSEITELK